MRVLNLVLCDEDGTDKTIRALDRDGNFHDIADIQNNLWYFLVPARIESGVLAKNLGAFTDMDAAGWNAIKAWYKDVLPDVSCGYAVISNSQKTPSHGLPTGTSHLLTFKNSNNYGSIFAFYNYPPTLRSCTINEGSFSDFSTTNITGGTP